MRRPVALIGGTRDPAEARIVRMPTRRTGRHNHHDRPS